MGNEIALQRKRIPVHWWWNLSKRVKPGTTFARVCVRLCWKHEAFLGLNKDFLLCLWDRTG